MATTTKFYFTGKDDTAKAFNNIKKSLKQISLQAVALTTAIRALGAVVKATASALTKVLGAALTGLVNLIKGALNTIKALITGTVKFIKSALSTLLSWMKKALAKVFSWISSSIKNIITGMANLSTKAIQAARKVIDNIVEGVKAYAAKEYNTIQLKVSLGDSYDSVLKSFKELLKYTTADKNELLSVFATYAELGKKPEEIEKYARATVYLANATGRSLSQIQRLLLGQEAAGKDLENVLNRIGVTVKDQESSLTNVEKIVAQLDEEMTALATDSLSQIFANIKNDVITIRENLGQLFSGPVRYVAQKIEGLLDKVAGSNKISGLADRLDKVFDKIKPYIDKIFTFFEKFIQDPGGFFKALWADIQTIFSNLWNNFGDYLSIAGYIIGQAVQEIGAVFRNIDWTGLRTAFTTIGEGLSNFTINIGLGAGLIDFEDAVSGSLTKTFINAWNKAVPDFQMSADDPWYKNLIILVSGALSLAWSGLKLLWKRWDIGTKLLNVVKTVIATAWSGLQYLWKKWDLSTKIASLWDDFKQVFTDKILPTLVTAFQYLGQVLGVAINNAIASSETIRKVLNIIPGVNFASSAELKERQASLYEKTKQYLPSNWTASDLTYENLMSSYSKNQTWMYHLLNMVEDAREELTWIRKTDVLETKEYPSFKEFVSSIGDIWNPVETFTQDIKGQVVDANKAFREIDSNVEEISKVIGHGGAGFSMGMGGGGGGIQDFFSTSNEFKIKPYRLGGWAGLNGPEVAILGEDGPEYVIPNSSIRNGFDWSDPWSSAKNALNISKDLRIITRDTSAIAEWYENTPALETAVEDGVKTEAHLVVPWYKRIWNATKSVGSFIGKALGKTAGFLAQNGAFGSHIGNIAAGIKAQQDNGTLTIWTALGEIIKEFLPYLQKGLEVVGKIFDEAFDILGNAISILGERIGKMLLPMLNAFIPLMKTIADIVIALSPVIESILAPAIKVIAAILNILTGVLDKLMPVFAGLASVIQWVSDAIAYAIGSVINWLASWIPWISTTEVKKPKSIGDYYWDIMDTYNASKFNSATGIDTTTASVGMAGQTASYSGSNHIYITNDFNGSYIVGNGGMRELALIIKNTLEDLDYSGQTI